MKKYLFGLFAVGLAIGLSSFTIARSKVKQPAKTLTSYYWYNLDASNNTTTLAFGAVTHTEAEAIALLTGCQDTPTKAPCISGFPTQVGAGEPLPGDEGQIVRRTN